MKNEDIVTASEIGEFVYCKGCWWKHFMGISWGNPDLLLKGVATQANMLSSIGRFQKVKLLLIVSVALIFILVTLFQWSTNSEKHQMRHTQITWPSLPCTVFWLKKTMA